MCIFQDFHGKRFELLSRRVDIKSWNKNRSRYLHARVKKREKRNKGMVIEMQRWRMSRREWRKGGGRRHPSNIQGWPRRTNEGPVPLGGPDKAEGSIWNVPPPPPHHAWPEHTQAQRRENRVYYTCFMNGRHNTPPHTQKPISSLPAFSARTATAVL